MLSKFLSGTPTGKRTLVNPRRRWEDNIRMDRKEIGSNTRNWVDSAQDRDYWRALVNASCTFHSFIHRCYQNSTEEDRDLRILVNPVPPPLLLLLLLQPQLSVKHRSIDLIYIFPI